MPPDRLVEREAELGALDASVERANASGLGRLLVVEGAAGSGRSSLLRAMARRADVSGIPTATARAAYDERDFAFGVAGQLVAGLRQALPPQRHRHLLDGPARCWEWVLHPSRPSDVGGAIGDEGATRILGFAELVANAAADQPVVVAVDDCHLADEPSLRALLHLVARLDQVPAVVVVALPPVPPDGDAALLARLRHDPLGRVLVLGPLTLPAVSDLVRGRFPQADDAFCEAVHRLTAGTPALVAGLVEALDLDGSPPDVDGLERLAVDVPRSLRDAVWTQLADLGPDDVTVAQAAAVVGAFPDVDVLGEVAGVPPARARAAFERLGANGFLAPDGRPATSLVEAAVARSTAPNRAVAMHERAARVLLARGRSPGAVAAHLLATPPGGKDWVVATLWAAATAAFAAGDPGAAAVHLRRALAEPPLDDVRGDLLADLGLALSLTGEEDGIALLLDAAPLVGSRNRRAEVLLSAAEALIRAGRTPEADTILRRVQQANPTDRDVRRRTVAARRRAARQRGATRVAPAAGPELADQFGELDSPAARLLAAEAVLDAALTGGPAATVVARCRAIGGALRAADDGEEPAASATALAAALCGERRFAAELVGPYLADDRVSADTIRSAHARALARLLAGDLAGALDDAERCLTASRLCGLPPAPGIAGVRGIADLELAELDRASVHVARPVGASPPSRHPLRLLTAVARARLELELGRPQAALAAAEYAGAAALEAGCDRPAVAPWRNVAAVALRALGRDDDAARAATEELGLAEAYGEPSAIGVAHRTVGLCTDGPARLQHLHDAVDVLRGAEARLELGWSLHALGSALRAAGRRRQATPLLEEAAAIAEETGGARLHAVVVADLEMVTGTTARSVPGELTPGEQRVVDLVRLGYTNRRIAQELFVSVKAVEWHLRNAYLKLGVRSRRELLGSEELGA